MQHYYSIITEKMTIIKTLIRICWRFVLVSGFSVCFYSVRAAVTDLQKQGYLEYTLVENKPLSVTDSNVFKWERLGDDEIFNIFSDNKYIIIKVSLPSIYLEKPCFAFQTVAESWQIYAENNLIVDSGSERTEITEQLQDISRISFAGYMGIKNFYIISSFTMMEHFNERTSYLWGDADEIQLYTEQKNISEIKSTLIYIGLSGILLFLGLFALIMFVSNMGKRSLPFLYNGLFALFAFFKSISENNLIYYLFKFDIDNIIVVKYTESYVYVFLVILIVKSIFGAGWKDILTVFLWTNVGYILLVTIFVYQHDFHIISKLGEIYSILSVPIVFFIIATVIKSDIYKIIRRNIAFHLFSGLFLIVALYSLFDEILAFEYNENIFLVGMLSISMATLTGLFTLVRYKEISFQQNTLELEKNRADILSLQHANIQAQFETYKNQVNPHFLFNCLTTLSSLCYPNPKPDKSKKFIDEFSSIYRYILKIKDKQVITLEEELNAIASYIYLQKIRFEEELVITSQISRQYYELILPPLSLQFLIENAIKHNKLSGSNPLTIEIYVDDEYIIVKNNLQRRSCLNAESTGIGQNNLMKRYSLLTDKKPCFYVHEGFYYSKIPLLSDE